MQPRMVSEITEPTQPYKIRNLRPNFLEMGEAIKEQTIPKAETAMAR